MNDVELDVLADKLAQRVNERRSATPVGEIGHAEHTEHHLWLRKWVKPLTVDLEAVGRRVILFGFFFVIAAGIAVMIAALYLAKVGILPAALKGGLVDPTALMAWVKGKEAR